jgi:hypothetical protein
MQVGNLVKVLPSKIGYYIVVSVTAHDTHNGKYLPKCLMIASLEDGSIAPMDRKFIEVISHGKQ